MKPADIPKGLLGAPPPCLANGHPWWLRVGVATSAVALAAASVSQRHGMSTIGWAVVGGLAAATPFVVEVFNPRRLPAPIMVAWNIAGVTLLMLHPVEYDMSPVLLMVMAAAVTALAGARAGIAATCACLAVLTVIAATVGLPDAGVNFVGVLLAFDVGFTMLAQQRTLEAERGKQRFEAERAAEAERRRIAREIHDVVGHSLSVTLLHLTGARHVLERRLDVETAIAALRDAEQVGRQAMGDIRRTVGLLGDVGAAPVSLPGLADIQGLVSSVRDAGVSVSYRQVGPLPDSPAVGLALYRLTQESLANVAKHAPSAATNVRLSCTVDRAQLTIDNDMTRPLKQLAGGSGLTGMAARVAQLGGTFRVGPDSDGRRWHVAANLPLTSGPIRTEAAAEPPRTPGGSR